MTPFGRPQTTSYQSAIVIIALSCTTFEIVDVEEYCELEIWVRDHCEFMHDLYIAELHSTDTADIFIHFYTASRGKSYIGYDSMLNVIL